MAIPRNVNGINPAKVKKNGTYMSEHQNALLQSEHELTLPTSDSESLPDFEDAFQTDEGRSEKARIFEEVKNLDESELDELLGINDLDDEKNSVDQPIELSFNDDLNQDTPDNADVDEDNELPDLSEIELPNLSINDDEENNVDSADFIFDEDDETLSEEDDADSTIVLNEEDYDDNDEEESDNNLDQIMSEMSKYLEDDEEENDDEEEDIIIFDEDDEELDEDESLIFEEEENNNSNDEDSLPFISFEEDDSEEDDETFIFEEIDEEDENLSQNDDAFSEEEFDEEIPAVQSLSKKKNKKTQNNQEEIEKDQRVPSDSKKKNEFFQNLIQRLALMKEQIFADMKGEEIPQSLPVKEETNDAENDDTQENEDEERKKQKQKSDKKNNSPLKKIKNSKVFSPFIKLYQMLVKLSFGIINIALGMLSKLPFIGKLFKPLLSASKTLEKIATAMPVVMLILILVLVNIFSVPLSYESKDLPDGAAVSISEFNYENGIASATVQNTGEVILDSIKVDFTVYSMQPSWNPKTWIIPQPASSTCSTDAMTIDIESETEISVSCTSERGKLPRVSAELSQ